MILFLKIVLDWNSSIWLKVFKNGQEWVTSNFLKAVFHKFYLVQS